MTTSDLDPGDGSGSYIRGGAGVVDTRRLFRVVGGLVIAVLVALLAALTVNAVHENSRIDSLRHRGIAVDVTVTNCLGVLSGTGVTVAYFQCSGSYDLGGRTYNGVIAGSHVNHAAGDVVEAVADPRHPTTISTATSLAKAHSSWRPFIAPGIVFVVLVLLILFGFWWSRRESAQRSSGGETLG
ncbi:MAG TPA: hypothetical protein VK662_13770 [Acidothermaceae bacterium]|nr:hypothetical protein [Acidothermaceae bacterium]